MSLHPPHDPFAGKPEGVTDAQHLTELGYTAMFCVGGPDAAFRIRTFARTEEPRYLISVEDISCPPVYSMVDTFGELMDTLARWSPVVQAAALIDAIDDVGSDRLSAYGFAERVGAKLHWGQEHGYEEMMAAAEEDRQVLLAAQKRAAAQDTRRTQLDARVARRDHIVRLVTAAGEKGIRSSELYESMAPYGTTEELERELTFLVARDVIRRNGKFPILTTYVLGKKNLP